MKNRTVNGTFSFSVPDDFEDMSEEQLRKFYSTTEGLTGYYHTETNSMINVGFVPKKGLVSALFSAKDIIKSYDAGYSRRLENYEKTGDITRTAAGEKCVGMSFSYTTKSEHVPVSAEVVTIKHKGAFYTVIFSVKKDSTTDLQKLSSEVLSTVRFEN